MIPFRSWLRHAVPRVFVAGLTTFASRAAAQPAPQPSEPDPNAPWAPAPAPPAEPPPPPSPTAAQRTPDAVPKAAISEDSGRGKVTPLGYVEAYYAYNLNRPSNGITNFRGFDNRHHTFSLSNVALGANFEAGPIGGRLILQVGSTPSSYYSSEPVLAGAGANPNNPALWKYLQEAFVTYRAPIGRGLLLQLGLCASPVGIEVIPVKDNWNWSRSNLFFGLPFYHTGLRATYELTDEVTATVSVFNGWNSVVDNNEEKSLQANLTYKIKDQLLVQALYFGGVERPRGSPEGAPWRHHFDAFGQYDATRWLSLAGQIDYGWESSRFGFADWIAGAFYARVRPMDCMYVAFRGDRFHENLASSGGASSSPIFWSGIEWVSSGTVTLDMRPHDQMSVRLEYRHDAASAPLYFGRNVRGDGSAATPYLANATTQDTVLLGATAWF